jgi:cytochrome c553
MISMFRLALCLTFSFALLGNAAAEGNVESGRDKSYTCSGCHGIPGYRNVYPHYHVPKIAGQNREYLIAALTAYQKGERPHPTMRAQAESFNAQDIEDIAAYLSSITKGD